MQIDMAVKYLAAFAKCTCKHGTWLIARGNEAIRKGEKQDVHTDQTRLY